MNGLAEGRWRWLIDAVDDDGNSSTARREFSVNNTLGFLELSKRQLKRGSQLGVEFSLDHDARVGVTVEKAAGGVVRTLLSEARKQGEVDLAVERAHRGRRQGRAGPVPGAGAGAEPPRSRRALEGFTVGAAKA